MRILVKNISKVYEKDTLDEKLALTGVTFQALPGDAIGIIGPTGAGKTTLINCIAGLINVSSGQITYDNFTVTAKTKLRKFKKIRKDVSISYQNPDLQLFKEKVFDDIAMPLTRLKLSEKEINERVLKACEQAHFSKKDLNKNTFNLSSGEKRKVIIASLLITEPQVMIFDEPTAYLDPASVKIFVAAIKELNKKYNKTIFIVSHHLDVIEDLTTRVIFLKEGILYAEGTTHEILRRKKLLIGSKMVSENYYEK